MKDDDVRLARDAWAARATRMEIGGEQVAVVDIAPQAGEAGDPAGPPLLVIHGFPTSSVDFQLVIEQLSARRRVVLLDFPGFGLSDKPDRPYSLFAQADVVMSVVAALGLREVDLLTHDMGDSVGGELLARSLDGDLPWSVRRRVLTNGSIYLDLAQLTDGQKLLAELPDAQLPEGSGVDASGLSESLVALCGPDTRTAQARSALRVGAELVLREDGHRLLPRLIRYLEERRRHERRWTGAIESHPAPVTVVWGRHDPIAVAGMAEQLAKRRPDAVVAWLDAGHWPMIEQPQLFAGAILEALQ